MKKIKETIPAKINLALDVVGVSNGFHNLETLVASISLYNEITVKKRKDHAITVVEKGIPADCPTEKLNAFKGAKIFQERYNTCGVDIVIERNIPVGGGLGCSSADTAGVLKGLQELFEIKESMSDIANLLGSDTAYMLEGGYALLTGRGDKIERLYSELKLYGILLPGAKSVNTKECYNKFDEIVSEVVPSAYECKDALIKGDLETLGRNMKNDLYIPAISILPEIETRLSALKNGVAKVMTGSGSAVYAIYKDAKQRDKAFEALNGEYKTTAVKFQTV